MISIFPATVTRPTIWKLFQFVINKAEQARSPPTADYDYEMGVGGTNTTIHVFTNPAGTVTSYRITVSMDYRIDFSHESNRLYGSLSLDYGTVF